MNREVEPAPERRQSLGEILISKGQLSREDLKAALDRQRSSGKRLGDILVERELVSSDAIVDALAEQLGIGRLRSNDAIRPEAEALDLLTAEQATRHRALPLALSGDQLDLAMVDPLDPVARDEITRLTGKNLVPVVCAEPRLLEAIHTAYAARQPVLGDGGDELETAPDVHDVNLDDLRTLVNDAPIVKLVNSLVVKAIRDGASDIHVEPQKKRLKIRYRIDGVLYPLASVSRDLAAVVISRIKILSDMDIAERRLPQDGRFTVVFDKKEIDLRVSSLPGTHGEKVVLRILPKDDLSFSLSGLGLTSPDEALLRKYVERPQGLVLVTGPTGSGKTTTLYACLSAIDRESLNVVTLEDPVEYQLAGIHQVQMNSRIGLSFAEGLRTVLRQDPDVVMLGEIRDRDTAEMAIRAALTGHLVLSTLHANDAMGTIARLVNMGIEPFLVAEAVSLVGGQRLLRTNCPDCLETYVPDRAVLARLHLPTDGAVFRRGTGCDSCRGIGFRGRTVVMELAEMDDDLRELVIGRSSTRQLRTAAQRKGMHSIFEDGIARAIAGRTTPEEVLRVCAES